MVPCPFSWSHKKPSCHSKTKTKKHQRPHCGDYRYCSRRLPGVCLSHRSKRSGQKRKVSTAVEEVTRSKDLMKSQSLKLLEVICSWRNKSATAAVSDKNSISTWRGFQKKPFLALRERFACPITLPPYVTA